MIKVFEVSSDTNIGGAGKCLLILLKELDKSQFDVTVVLPKNSLLKQPAEELGARIIEVDGIADKSLDFAAIKELKQLFKDEKPDIVHTHASMSARIAAKLAGCGVVYTRHSVFPPSRVISRGIGKFINGAVNNLFADRIIAVAEAAKDNLVQTGVSAKKIDVILNGVYPARQHDKEEAKRHFGIPADNKVVSIVARLEDIKGHDYFIEAAKMLEDEGVKASFVIAGTGSYENALKEKAEKLGCGNVIFTGFIDDTDRLLSATDVQVNASYGTEATSLALLEGMSLGVPAVVSDFGGNPGVITNAVNGFIVPRQNSKALADCIAMILRNNELHKKLFDGAKTVFNSKFTAEIMTKNTENVYREVFER